MKKSTELLFWTFLALVAVFYIFKGNDMHKEREEMIKEKFSQKEEVKKAE